MSRGFGRRAADPATGPPPSPRPDAVQRALMPGWLRRSAAYGLVALVAVAVLWVLAQLLLHVALVSFTVAVALLLTALLWPVTHRLRRNGVPAGLAALLTLVLLLALVSGVGVLVWTRAEGLAAELVPAVTAGIDDVRSWLVDGPVSMDASRVDSLRDQLVERVYDAVPSPIAGARAALDVLAGLVLALFLVFFLLKDGPRMWSWALERVPAQHRDRTDGAGCHAWSTLTSYTVGAMSVALVDAVLIGAGLLLLDVPLWLSLALLTFVSAFVPILGATLSGAVAVLVTLVTNGGTDAVIILVIVLVVQQVEGNLLQPLVMGRAVHLHPVVTLVAVTSGFLLLGIPGAVVAVPVVAVLYQVTEYLRTTGAGEQR